MKTRGSYGENFGVCDFCDTDSSAYDIKWVQAIGEKGICNNCARQLADLLVKAKNTQLK